MAALQQFLGLEVGQLTPGFTQSALEERHHLFGITVRTADGFVHDFVDQAERLETVCGDAEGIGSGFGFFARFPQNGGTAFRADDRVNRVLQHQHLVGHRNRQRTTRSAFANDGGDDGHLKLGHFENIAANGLGLATLFGVDPRVSAGRVDKSKDRKLEFFGGLHQAQGFAVALGLAHAKVAQGTFFGVTPLLLANHHAGLAIETGQPPDDGQVVGKVAVTVHLDKVGEDAFDVIQGVGTLRVA